MFLLALALAAAEPPRPMVVEIAEDPITDQVGALATLRADGNRLVVGCDPSRYERVRIILHSRRWFGRGDLIRGRMLTHRFDDNPPRRLTWTIRRRSAILSRSNHVDAFLASLAAADRLVIRARDIEGHRFDMIFDTAGARAALDQALETCGESPAGQ